MSTEARIRRRWTAEEDELLRKEARSQLMQGSLKDWNRIAAKLEGRTNKDCRKRWLKVHKNLKRGSWDSAEDMRLQQGIQQHGFRWTKVANVVKTRHADQCARRWHHSLDPSIDRSVWSEEEDKKLLGAVQRLGHNWTTITESEMPLRSATDVRNRYILIARKYQRNPAPSASMEENNSQASSPAERIFSTESDSEGGESEDDEIEEGASKWPFLSPLPSSRASPSPQLTSVPHSAPGHTASADLNYKRYTAPAPPTDRTAITSPTSMDYTLSAQDQMYPFILTPRPSNEELGSFLGPTSTIPLEVDLGSYAETGTNSPSYGYDLLGNPISGVAFSSSGGGQDFPQLVNPTANQPMRTTLTLEASSSALTDVLATLLKTNTRFTIEANNN